MMLFNLQTFTLSAKVVFKLAPDENQFARALTVVVFDCNELTEDTLYTLYQVRPWHITSEILGISEARIVLYTKNFRKELNA